MHRDHFTAGQLANPQPHPREPGGFPDRYGRIEGGHLLYQLYRVGCDARPGEDGEACAELVTLKITPATGANGTPHLVVSLPRED